MSDRSFRSLLGGARGSVVDRPRLHTQVVEELTRRIVQEEWVPGSALPTESELAEQFDVSRTVIREAIRLLGSKGLIIVKHGSGVYVQPPDKWDHLDPLILVNRLEVGQDESLLTQLLEVRRMIEVEVAGLAAVRRSAEDVETLGQIVSDMRLALASENGNTLSALDLRFHETIFSASGNLVLRQMVWTIATLFRAALHIHRSRPPRREESYQGHLAIFAAIDAGDAERARQEMLGHINQAAEDIRASVRARWARDRQLAESDAANAALAAD